MEEDDGGEGELEQGWRRKRQKRQREEEMREEVAFCNKRRMEATALLDHVGDRGWG